MRLEEARRITGRHPLLSVPGAGGELLGDVDVDGVRRRLQEAFGVLGWRSEVVSRAHTDGVSIAFSAPVDLLYTAVAALEWAASTEARGPLWDAMLAEREREENPRLRELMAALGPAFCDEEALTAGLGVHARTWPLDALPDHVSDAERIPFAYVTGTNGKTTTTRMLSRIAREAGRQDGHTSSDGIVVRGDWVERGDWTGPGAARTLLRRPDVDFAVLETARGGLLRRGLVLDGADVAVITNVSADHLGEWGLHDVADMAWAKLTVAGAVRQGGTLVVRDQDVTRAQVARWAAERPDLRIARFGDGAAEGLAGWLEGDEVWLHGEPLMALTDIPATADGLARHNGENALAAALAAHACGFDTGAIVAGLRAFRPTLAESRGRLNRFTLPDGTLAVVDFAHNPDGIAALGGLTAASEGPMSVVFGQAGDRSDASLAACAQAIAGLGADTIVFNELPDHLRGAELGATSRRLRDHLVAAGTEATILLEADEVGATAVALDAAAGGLALLLVKERVDEVVAALVDRGAREP